MDLTAFLRARLDEDEAEAKAAGAEQWEFHPDRRYEEWTGSICAPAEPLRPGGAPYRIVANCEDEGAHIARHDPARVLREVDAKRAILELHHPVPAIASGSAAIRIGRSSWMSCAICHGMWPCATVRALIAVYADHPDYDPAWATSVTLRT